MGGPPPRAAVHALQGRRERGREEDREHEAEQAGRLADVVRGRETIPDEHERVTLKTESGRQGGDDGCADPLGHEGGDDDHEREERDEGLPSERDAAVDELDLEHAFPHPTDEQPLQPRLARPCVDEPRWCRAAGDLLVLGYPRVSVLSACVSGTHHGYVFATAGGRVVPSGSEQPPDWDRRGSVAVKASQPNGRA